MTWYRAISKNIFLLALPYFFAAHVAADSSVQTQIPAAAAPLPASALVEEGNKAFSTGDYPQAITAYIKAQGLGATNGYLEYNLGNAYAKNDSLGQAILHLRRSAVLLGADPEVEANLKFLRNKSKDEIHGSCPTGSSKLSIAGTGLELTRIQQLWCVVFFWAFAWTIYGLGSLSSNRIVYFAAVVSFAGAVIGGFLYWRIVPGSGGEACLSFPALSRPWAIDRRTPVVVLAPQVEVRSGNSAAAQVVSVLHEGSELLAGESSNGFVQLYLPGGRTGFVPQSAVEVI